MNSGLPETPFPIVWFPIVMLIVSAWVWYAGVTSEARGRAAKWKWLAVLPLLVMLFINSIPAIQLATDTAFKLTWPGRKVMYSLWAVGFLPLVGAIFMVVWHFVGKSRVRRW